MPRTISGPAQPQVQPAASSAPATPVPAGPAQPRTYPAQPATYPPVQAASARAAGALAGPAAGSPATISPTGYPITSAGINTAPAATFGVRLGAFLIDQTITLFAAAVAAYAASGSPSTSTAAASTDTAASPALTLAFLGFALLIQAVYYGYCWSAGGRTMGYRVFGLRLTRSDGSPVPVGTALLRYIVYLVASAPLYLGFLWMLWDPARQTWAEKLTGTMVTSSRTQP